MSAPIRNSQTFLPDEAWPALAARLELSPREVQIAKLVGRDLKELAIARRLQMSTHTVHTHLERLYRKLGVSSRLQLVVVLSRAYLELVRAGDDDLPPVCPTHARGACPLRS